MAAKISFDKFYNVINGQLRDSPKTRHGINPSTEERLWDVPVPTEQDVEEAVAAANAAYKKWHHVPREERNKLLGTYSDAISQHMPQLLDLLMKENGKSEDFAKFELGSVPSMIKLNQSYTTPVHVITDDEKTKVITKYVPVGACVGILAWNFPVSLFFNKLLPALATGNTIIFKPSPYTPYTVLKLTELAIPIFPPGVVQILGDNDDNSVGPMLVKHPDIAKISFTGSIATGKKVMAAAAGTLKRLTLELGGNDAAIVCEDADIPSAAQNIAFSTFSHSGQICLATKRIYVHSKVYESFMEAFIPIVKSFQPGTGVTGPIQNSMQFNKVKSVYDDCVVQKLNFALGDGKIATDKSGYFAAPTIVAKPPETSRVVQEEAFGPIVPVCVWDDEQDVLERANATDAGLGASVYSKDEEKAWRMAEALEAGSVWINGGWCQNPGASIGGHKQSGFGRELGELALIEYCNAKTYSMQKSVAK